jgi:hypothetical protein
MHFSNGEVIAEERRDLGTAKSLKAAKAIAMSDWAKRSVISTDPLPVMKPTVLEWKSVTPDLEASFSLAGLGDNASRPLATGAAPWMAGNDSGSFGFWRHDRACLPIWRFAMGRRPAVRFALACCEGGIRK